MFSVVLPAARSDQEQTSSAGAVRAIVRRRVLMVDDDDVVIRALVRALRAHHDIVGVTTAESAIAELERGPLPDVLLCDVMMPDTTGAALVEQISERWPVMRERVLFLTGGAFGEGARELEAREHGRVLHKPIALADLLDAIERVGPR